MMGAVWQGVEVWHLGPDSGPQLIASKEMSPQCYDYKEIKLANNLAELGSQLLLRLGKGSLEGTLILAL